MPLRAAAAAAGRATSDRCVIIKMVSRLESLMLANARAAGSKQVYLNDQDAHWVCRWEEGHIEEGSQIMLPDGAQKCGLSGFTGTVPFDHAL